MSAPPTIEERLKELEELVSCAVVEGYWECPEGCENPDPDPDNGRLCSECCDEDKESVRIPEGYGHPALLAYLEKYVWETPA